MTTYEEPAKLAWLEALNLPVVDAVATEVVGEVDPHAEGKSELGNAEKLVRQHGADFRYIAAWGWLVWDGQRWVRDDTGEVVRRAKRTVRAMYAEAEAYEDEARTKLVAHALRSESAGQIKAMIELAQSEPGVAAKPSEFDTDVWLLNVANGTLDLRTGLLREHRREDMITKLAPVAYNPTAFSLRFGEFVQWMYSERPGMIDYVQRLLGYSLTGLANEHVLPIMWGSGGNGKSTLLDLVGRVLGDYAATASAAMLVDRKGGEMTNDLARLFGTRFVVAHESDEGAKLAEGLVKQMTGGDRLSVRFLHKEFFEFLPTFTIFLVTNHKPRVRGTDEGIWRRLRLIAHEAKVTEEMKDRDLAEKLWDDAEAVLAWLVAGCAAWKARGLTMPEEVRLFTSDYRSEQDLIAEFLEDHTVADYKATCFKSSLYKAYSLWAEERGERPISQKALSQKLQERGYLETKDTRNNRCWLGLRLDGEEEA